MDVLGAVEDGSVMAFIFPIAIFERQNSRPTHACCPLHLPLGDT